MFKVSPFVQGLLVLGLCLVSVTQAEPSYDSQGVETLSSIQAVCNQDPGLLSGWDLHVFNQVCNTLGSPDTRCFPQRRVSQCADSEFAGVVVLYHAFTECPFTQAAAATALQQRCFDVLIPLLPGHGATCSSSTIDCIEGRDVSSLPTNRTAYINFVDQINDAAREAVEDRLASRAGRPEQVTADMCSASDGNDESTSCGFFGITSDECSQRGCCWNADTASCVTPSAWPFVVGVGGESTGGALATLSAARTDLYTRQVVVNGFYGVTEARLDHRVEKCLHGNLGLVQCLVQALSNYEGLSPEAAAQVGPVVSKFMEHKFSHAAVKSWEELEYALREVLENFAENPHSSVAPLLEATMSWGGYCKKSLTSGYNGAGFCDFRIKHLLAAHSAAQFAHRSARYTAIRDAQFITVESDGLTRNKLAFSAARRTAQGNGTRVSACMYWQKDNCTPSLRSHECGVPHLALNPAKAASYPPGTAYWQNGLVASIAAYFSTGLPVGKMDWDESNNVCVQETLENPSPQAGPLTEQAEVVITRPGGGPMPPPGNVYDSVHDTIVSNTGLTDEEAGGVITEPPIDDSDKELASAPSYRGGFEVFKSQAASKQIYFRLKAANYKIILASEGYTQIGSAENGVRGVIDRATSADNFELIETDGKYRFTLKAANGQIIAHSQVYTSAAGRDNGIKSVMTNAARGIIKYLDGLDEGGVFALFKSDKDSKFYFNLRAANGQVIARSQGYTTKYSAKKGIASVRTNGVIPTRYAVQQSSDGQVYFNLKAGNGRVIATSERYTTRSSADNGMYSIIRLVRKATIRDESVSSVSRVRTARRTCAYGDAQCAEEGLRLRELSPLAGSPRFTVFCGKNGDFYFNLKAANNEIILASQGYKSIQSAESGVLSVLANAPIESRFAKKDNGNSYSFTLRSRNGRVIGHSESYTSSSGRDNGIKAVASAAPGASIQYTCRSVYLGHHGRFIVKHNRARQPYFNLVSRNSRVLCTSESYSSSAAARKGTESVRANAAIPKRFSVETAKNGGYYFNLKAGNGQVICTSQVYKSRSSVNGGLGAVMRLAPEALLVDQTRRVVSPSEDDEREVVMVDMPGSSARVFRDAASDQNVGEVEGLAVAAFSSGEVEVDLTEAQTPEDDDEGGKSVSLPVFLGVVGAICIIGVAAVILIVRRRGSGTSSLSSGLATHESRAADDGTQL